MSNDDEQFDNSPCKLRDPKIRANFLGILRVGVSKRDACKCINISHSTLTRECQRDPDLKADVTAASLKGKVALVSKIAEAAKKDWKAAAWLLERKYPEDFAKRQPGVVTDEQFNQKIQQLAIIVLGFIPPERQTEAQACITDLITNPVRGYKP